MTREKPEPIFTVDNLKKNIINIIVGIVITAGVGVVFKSYSDQQKLIVDMELMKKDIAIIKTQADGQEATLKALDKLTTRLETIIERGR